MPASGTSVTDAAIQAEILKALRILGDGPETLSALAITNYPLPLIYDTFRRLGAQSDLLSIVGSWGDTVDDERVLEQMQK